MTNIKVTRDDAIPEEFRLSTSCFCSFWKVRSPLETEAGTPDRVLHSLILITKKNNLIEIQNKVIKRVHVLKINNICKVGIHQEFDPFSRYIFILTEANTAQLLDYESLEVLNVWNLICEISSKDISDSGRPKLTMRKGSGENFTVSKEEFLVKSCLQNQEKCKTDALTALNNKLMSMVSLWESMNSEKIRKENFICQKTSELTDLLRQDQDKNTINFRSGHLHSEADESQIPSTFATAAADSHRELIDNSSTNKESILKLTSVRQRIIHNKWVICISLLNGSERYLVYNPNVVLHSNSLKCLNYKIRLLKTYQKTPKNGSATTNSAQKYDVIFEDLDPPIIRPKKKAFLIVMCDFPDFTSGQEVSCGGVVSFQLRSLKTDGRTQSPLSGQIPFPTLSLDALNFSPVCVDIKREQGSAGLSFDVFVLIVASVCHKITITSIASPLDQFIEVLLKDTKILKITSLKNFYCFYAVECTPLHLAAFICKPLSANRLLLTTYTKDDNQGLILLHNLKSSLPRDAFISVESDEDSAAAGGSSLENDLVSKMNVVVSKIRSASEGNIVKADKKTKKTPDADTALPNDEMEWSEKEYLRWREELCRLSIEMEDLYIKCN